MSVEKEAKIHGTINEIVLHAAHEKEKAIDKTAAEKKERNGYADKVKQNFEIYRIDLGRPLCHF